MKIIIYAIFLKGILMVWICSMIASMAVNVYEDMIKYMLNSTNSDQVQSQSYHLVFRSLAVLVASLIYIFVANIWTPRIIHRLWIELKDWSQQINIDTLTYNALAPLEPSRNR